MRTSEVKQRLIDEINSSTNKNLLEEMYNYFAKDNAVEAVYNLSDNQKLEIEKGRNQVQNGQCFSNEDVNAETEKWLNEK